MKLTKGIYTIPLLLGLLYGCNNDDTKADDEEALSGSIGEAINHDENNNNENKNNNNNNNNNSTVNDSQDDNERTTVKAGDVNYPFTEFDLDIEYDNNTTFNVEYENDGKYIYAELEDDSNNVTYRGDEAYDKIVDSLNQLTFDETTSEEDVRKEVLKAFAREENYKSFELEVIFNKGQKKHYHHKK